MISIMIILMIIIMIILIMITIITPTRQNVKGLWPQSIEDVTLL